MMVSLASAAKWLGLSYALALAALWAWQGEWGEPVDWIVALLFLIWQLSPAAAAAACVRASRGKAGKAAFLILEAAIILSTAWMAVVSVLNPDPQAPIALLVFMPLWQWGAFVPFLGLALLVGWRPREAWLRG